MNEHLRAYESAMPVGTEVRFFSDCGRLKDLIKPVRPAGTVAEVGRSDLARFYSGGAAPAIDPLEPATNPGS